MLGLRPNLIGLATILCELLGSRADQLTVAFETQNLEPRHSLPLEAAAVVLDGTFLCIDRHLFLLYPVTSPDMAIVANLLRHGGSPGSHDCASTLQSRDQAFIHQESQHNSRFRRGSAKRLLCYGDASFSQRG